MIAKQQALEFMDELSKNHKIYMKVMYFGKEKGAAGNDN